MTSRFILSVLLLGVAVPSAHALVERQLVKTFPTPAAGAVLAVYTFSGEIRVTLVRFVHPLMRSANVVTSGGSITAIF
jgi:hypothetical protein